MAKMWAGRFQKEESKEVNDFNSSISFDSRMYESDITGSIAHARMLGNQGIISKEDSELIIDTLTKIFPFSSDIESKLPNNYSALKDIQMTSVYNKFSITPIFDETFAPPKIAKNGLCGLFKASPIIPISF